MKQLTTIQHYKDLALAISTMSNAEQVSLLRQLFRIDLFALLFIGCGRIDMAHPWLLERCKEIQKDANGHLDLWSREHYKSTIITFGKTLQDIIASHGEDPLPEWKGSEPSFGIFSCTRPIAKGFLRQLKREFEGNALLRMLYPDIIWENCHKEAPKWSEDDGLILKRKSNPKESTIEAWGLVDGQPTSKHFDVCVYDDVVTIDNVRSPNMIAKTTEAWELSINLGSEGGIRRYIGTRYHFNDTYKVIMDRGSAIPRVYTATQDGSIEGIPVLLSHDSLAQKRRDMGVYTFNCQMLQNPVADDTKSLKRDWLRWYGTSDGSGLNKYILVDPANEKKRNSDYSVFMCVGLGPDGNKYLLDIFRDRLNLVERIDALFRMHRKWRPLGVGYEHYGMQADTSYLSERQKRENYHFQVTPLGGNVPKIDRIQRMIPDLCEGRWYLPDSIYKTNYEGKVQDLIDIFLNEEYLAFPVPVHDDMLDCMSRIYEKELNLIWPRLEEDEKPTRYRLSKQQTGSAWAG